MAVELKVGRGAAAPDVTTAEDALAFAGEYGVEMVDLKFTDLPGTWQHMQMPLDSLDADDFDAGLGFDGSSIRGFQQIDEPDAIADLRGRRPADARAVLARPPPHRGESRAASRAERYRRHVLLRPGGGVLRVRPPRLRAA